MSKISLIKKIATDTGMTDYEEAEQFVFTVVQLLPHLLPEEAVTMMAARLPGDLQQTMLESRLNPMNLDTAGFISQLMETMNRDRSDIVLGLRSFFRVVGNERGLEDLKDEVFPLLPEELRQMAWTAQFT